jgi:hypothetical protein
MRIDGATIPAGKFLYEVAGDDDSGGDLAKRKACVMVNFFGTLICHGDLSLEDEGIWVVDGEGRWL